MDTGYKRLTDFLAELGVAKVAHTQKTYLGHLVALYRLMEAQRLHGRGVPGGDVPFDLRHPALPGVQAGSGARPEVRRLIGERAERLAYLNCAMDRATFDRAVEQTEAPYPVRDRLTGEEVMLSATDFDDLCRIHLYDWLEQVPRSREWDYRRRAYRRAAERLGGGAVEDYDRVFAAESDNRTGQG